jgi:hypothetical protein
VPVFSVTSERVCCDNYKVRFTIKLNLFLCLDLSVEPGQIARGLLHL